MQEICQFRGIHQLHLTWDSCIPVGVWIPKGLFSVSMLRVKPQFESEGAGLESRSEKWWTMNGPLQRAGATGDKGWQGKGYSSPFSNEPRVLASSRWYVCKDSHSHCFPMQHPKGIWERGVSISFCSFMLWERIPVPQCTWHITGREVSRLTVDWLYETPRGRTTNFVDGDKDEGKQKRERFEPLAPRSKRETQEPQSLDGNT